MDPATIALLAKYGIPAAVSFLGGLVGGGGNEGTKYKPFAKGLASNMVGRGTDQAQQWLDALTKRFSQPTHLRGAYAQPLPGFSGGGLPMNIGAPAMDPGFLNKNLYDMPGITAGVNMNNMRAGTAGNTRRNINNAPVTGTAIFRGSQSQGGSDPFQEAQAVLDMLGPSSRGRSMVR